MLRTLGLLMAGALIGYSLWATYNWGYSLGYDQGKEYILGMQAPDEELLKENTYGKHGM